MKEYMSIVVAVLAIVISIAAIITAASRPETTIDDDVVSDFEIADNSVTTLKILDNTITDDDIDDDCITKIKDVNMEDLGSDVIAALAGGGIVTENSITSSLIDDGTITVDDIGMDAVDSDEIVDGSITSYELANGSVTTEKIKDKAVTSAKIANGSVIIDKMADGVLTWDNIEDKPYRVVAAGIVNSDGTIENSYRVKTVFWDSSSDCYKINLINVDYDHDRYITMISSSFVNWDVFPTTGGNWEGYLIVRFYDVSAEVCVQHAFHFIVYDFGW